jgi:hypothetical protein
MKNVSYKCRDIGRDMVMDKIFKHFNFGGGMLLYNIITYNPIDVVIGILSVKFGVSKIIISLVLAFLL